MANFFDELHISTTEAQEKYPEISAEYLVNNAAIEMRSAIILRLIEITRRKIDAGENVKILQSAIDEIRNDNYFDFK